MKIWILENGEKSGPHELFLIRERISEGELTAETPAWYEGADEWLTLADVPSLSGLLASKEEKVVEIDEPESLPQVPVAPPVLPVHPWRRFFARLFDIGIYLHVVAIIKIQNGIDPFIPSPDPFREAMYHLPYVLLDAILIHIFATTPGKKLLGIQVLTAQGTKLPISSSIMRALRVWVLGFGMFIITPIAMLISFFMAKKFGRFIWDLPKNYQVPVKPLVPVKIVLYVVIFLSFMTFYASQIPSEYRGLSPQELLQKIFPKE